MLASEVLIENFNQGSLESFDELVSVHEQEIFNIVSALIASPQGAEEAAANVFVRLMDEAGTTAVRNDVRGQLLRFAWNEVRAFRLEQSLAVDSASEIEIELPRIPRPEADVAASRRQNCKSVLAHMPAESAMAFVLRKICCLSIAQAANVLEISQERATARLTTACRILRASERSHSLSQGQNARQPQGATEFVV